MYDIIFISYNEKNADINFANLKKRFPIAKRVHGVTGIHQAHIAAAKKALTNMFWVVDGDAEILDSFNFTFDRAYKDIDLETVYVYRSKNPINDLSYGYGGVKLLPKTLTLNIDISRVDMTTSISNKFIPLPEISNITAFNTDPFSTWRSAFRECVKLSSNSIDRQKNMETQNRLKVWCTTGSNKLFGNYAIQGANLGKAYGIANSENDEMISKINDWEWLENEFNKHRFPEDTLG